MMKSKLVPITGDHKENLYQLGLAEKASYQRLEQRVFRLLSIGPLLRHGQHLLIKAHTLLRKKKEYTFFDECIQSYAEGLGIDYARYMKFLSLFELAAHYGQLYPELKGLLPGCTTVFSKENEELIHSRLVDFPLLGIFDENPRLYLWQLEGKPTLLSYSCEGLAPLFFQVVHESGVSLALHHKPGDEFNRLGQSIFQIALEVMLEASTLTEMRKELKKKETQTKWSFLFLDKSGKVEVIDLDGLTFHSESFNLHESSPLIFTNIPLKSSSHHYDSFISFCHSRQNWLKQKLTKPTSRHLLDLMTDVEDQRQVNWLHPAATLSTTGAIEVNLTKGHLDLKEGKGTLVASDAIIRYSLADQRQVKILKEAKSPSPFEVAWKRAAEAQAAFDQGHFEEAYHELQMAVTLIPHPLWKSIFSFYLCLWDFKFIRNPKELSHVYKRLKKLEVPPQLKDQWFFLCMRLEKRLGLKSTIETKNLSPHLREHFDQELHANKVQFGGWMKSLYPRMEILDVFSPHHK